MRPKKSTREKKGVREGKRRPGRPTSKRKEVDVGVCVKRGSRGNDREGGGEGRVRQETEKRGETTTYVGRDLEGCSSCEPERERPNM